MSGSLSEQFAERNSTFHDFYMPFLKTKFHGTLHGIKIILIKQELKIQIETFVVKVNVMIQLQATASCARLVTRLWKSTTSPRLIGPF